MEAKDWKIFLSVPEIGEKLYDKGFTAKECEAIICICKRAGIREVVELIDKTGLIEHTDSPLHEIGATILDCPACCWYVYKKEWGL